MAIDEKSSKFAFALPFVIVCPISNDKLIDDGNRRPAPVELSPA